MIKNLSHKMKDIMLRILEVRYTDIEEEKKLCLELGKWAKDNNDDYAKAFSLVYLGDYSVALHDKARAGKYLSEAREILEKLEKEDELNLQFYSLMGIYSDMCADEQNTIEYYMKVISLAEKLNNLDVECVVLNNLAFVFQRHNCYEEARAYFIKAYELHKKIENHPMKIVLLSNLAEVCLLLGRLSEAKEYIEECDDVFSQIPQKEVACFKNWYLYYCAKKDKESAEKYAKLLVENKAKIEQDQLSAFEFYHSVCVSSMDIKNKQYSKEFLTAMENNYKEGSLDKMKVLEEAKIRYSILFENESQQEKAYERFHKKNKLYRAKVRETIVDAMKSQIYLDELVQQAKLMKYEKETLEKEVNIDELTNVYNRRFLEKLMRDHKEDAKSESIGFAMLDVDYFKEYNDTYGHIKGDMVLKEVADALKSQATDKIYPCRYGGDEFVCVFLDMTDAEVKEYIKRVQNCVHEKKIEHMKSRCSNEVTLSIGYAIEPRSEKIDSHLLFQLADQALYESKRSGRNMCKRKRADV